MNNYKQLTFTGGGFEMIKNHADKMREYERRKTVLLVNCTTCKELEKELIKLIKELNL